jgi:hypothetical protein
MPQLLAHATAMRGAIGTLRELLASKYAAIQWLNEDADRMVRALLPLPWNPSAPMRTALRGLMMAVSKCTGQTCRKRVHDSQSYGPFSTSYH